jgi:NTP pyrophosphatase (non-canonical NTP hydrolase)
MTESCISRVLSATAPPPAPQGEFSIGGQLWPGLSKLIEECGEVLQVGGKLIGNEGGLDHWDGTNLRTRMESELGDLRAAIDFFAEENGLCPATIERQRAAKLAMFRGWHVARLAERMA